MLEIEDCTLSLPPYLPPYLAAVVLGVEADDVAVEERLEHGARDLFYGTREGGREAREEGGREN